MKRWSISLGAVALIAATLPFLNGTPVMASLQQAGAAIAERLQRPEVKLNLAVEKQAVIVNEQGQKQVKWNALQGKALVEPGNVLRYSLTGKNAGDLPAQGIELTQPIPKGTKFVLNSATTNSAGQITYSIDNGKTFVEAPTVTVTLADGKTVERPAPAEAYTHVRWNLAKDLNPQAALMAAYQVEVR
ncbi:hypothetical protein Q2T42_23415 [Leptolyngbya boryana CZ1]|uniref:DUF11 domain-containing protein n=1 Tax=Leptolyngbya boryana CZ1 TaxID=3060204 RepID=A0AA96WRN8_LEPBY|nr:hypothetical protein [Leptolyngbya boryana]WNZ44746.1 hypothetical protein Q2T42_23415 [Leptolyngbya boryana CZ1]